ncbi:MAG: NADH-quinone oxidoreductase subunit N [Planctomycetota bacterium]|nr:NADH-quinone oxidoreductase subunit N [Planctomycetota bacterium]
MAGFALLSEIDATEFSRFRDAIWGSLEHFGAESFVVFAALGIFIVDLFLSRRNSRHIAWVAIAACLIAAWEPFDRLSTFLTTDLDPYAMTEGAVIEGAGSGSLFLGMLSFDAFSDFYKLFFLLGTIPVILLSYLSEKLQDRSMGEYYGILLAAVFGAMLMASSTHFLMLFMSLELLSICSYVLVGYVRRDNRGSEAALKYIIYGSVAAAVMAYGMSLYYGMTGSADLADMAHVLRPDVLGEGALESSVSSVSVTVVVSLLLIFVGIAYKIASIPMHFWAPDAYEGAPTPVTAFLSVLSKAAGFALAIRLFQSMTDSVAALPSDDVSATVWEVVGAVGVKAEAGGAGSAPWITLLIVISVLTMTLGNLAALWQTNLKRFMAYSSIAHAGYMMMGLTILNAPEAGGSEVGGIGVISFYLLTYLAMNFGAFAVIILVENRLGSVDIKDYGGLGRRAPFLAAALTVFLFSLIGVPPTAGFAGKWQLFMGILDMARTEYYVLAVAAAINTAISAYYYLRIVREMYLADSDDASPVTTSLLGKAVVAAMLFLTFYLFFKADVFLDVVRSLKLAV